MMRDLIGFGGHPPTVRWPNGARLAVNFVLNYEEGSELSPVNGDASREPATESVYEVETGDRQLLQETEYEFGSRVGAWRIMRSLDAHGMTATVFACAVALERNPVVTKAMVERGFDFVAHGNRWVRPYGMDRAKEKETIDTALDSIERSTGTRPMGWFSRPVSSVNTRRLIVAAGLSFDCDSIADEVPYYVDVDGCPHLVVPYTMDVNDFRFWKRTFFTGDQWFAYARDSFDTLYRESKQSTRLLSIGLHSRIIGRAGRIGALDRFQQYIRRFPDIWVCNRTELAKYWIESVPPESVREEGGAF